MTNLRVMTFNINGSAIDVEGEQNWQKRAPLNARTILRYAPDLIGFQEVEEGNRASYQTLLPGYSYVVGAMYDEPPYAAWTSIYWKAARFALVESGEFWFSRTPDVRSSDWGVPYPLGVTWVRLQDRQTNTRFLHMNTHFEDGPDGELSRVEASKLIVARATELAPDLPVIITGDFNCNPWCTAYNHLLANGFTDTYRAAGNADTVETNTYHGFTGNRYFALEWGEAGDLFWRIDWILTRDGAQRVQTKSSTIIRDAEPLLYPSDHYPVVSEVTLL